MKRTFKLDTLDRFQAKLEDFFKTLQAKKQQDLQDIVKYQELVYEYHSKMSTREISKATGIPRSTIASWIKKIEKKKQAEAQAHDQKAVQPQAN